MNLKKKKEKKRNIFRNLLASKHTFTLLSNSKEGEGLGAPRGCGIVCSSWRSAEKLEQHPDHFAHLTLLQG